MTTAYNFTGIVVVLALIATLIVGLLNHELGTSVLALVAMVGWINSVCIAKEKEDADL